MKICRILLIFILLFLSADLWAQRDLKEESIVQTDTLEYKNFRYLLVPLVFYLPETSFGFGLGGMALFKGKNEYIDTRYSNIFLSGSYTLNNQLIINLTPQLYFNDERYFLDGSLRGGIYPYRFWGVGPESKEEDEETYKQNFFEGQMRFMVLAWPALYVGMGWRFNFYDFAEKEEGGQLEGDLITGADGGNISGPILTALWDTRDNNFAPYKGFYIDAQAGWYNKAFGGNFNFSKYILDARYYWNIAGNHVLASHLYWENNYGVVPFQSMASIGSSSYLRGYLRGRFLDKHLAALQVEYRYYFWRMGVAGFFSVGDLDESTWDAFGFSKFTYGGGLRFKPFKGSSTLLRLDFGLSDDGGSGIYFGVNEAF